MQEIMTAIRRIQEIKKNNPEIEKMINNLQELGFIELIVLKKSRKAIKTGDVFVFSPRKGLYFYGKVLNGKIENIYKGFVHGNILIFIFQHSSQKIDIQEFKKDYSKLLLAPTIVTYLQWSMGYFMTIGNEEISEEEKNLDYGFYVERTNTFCKETGELIDHVPEILARPYGELTTPHGITAAVETEFIINPDLIRGYPSTYEYDFPIYRPAIKMTSFDKEILPFTFLRNAEDKNYSLSLETGEYMMECFNKFSNKGFQGNGYDWNAVFKAFVTNKCPEQLNKLTFDSEAGLFCVFTKNRTLLKELAADFKKACEDDVTFINLLKIAEPE